MAPSRVLIIGITGLEGYYLAEFLLARGYQVHGVIRRASSFNTARLDHFTVATTIWTRRPRV